MITHVYEMGLNTDLYVYDFRLFSFSMYSVLAQMRQWFTSGCGRVWPGVAGGGRVLFTILMSPIEASSYFCTEAVIDHVMITCMLAHRMKSRYNQSAILLPAFGRSIRVLHNVDS